ncbi:hypothetical protein LMG29542_07080 [Paraburkholderia humisilvae]|uniref:Uncharacterized protein n=1 Tax=Paraburkholderia humisilvae TaxID=627669 RepID=A0A6J5F2H6_9BURK|nr:hypothetical protein LMG29542_07080 [Paraburkholderia humisilvae]
MDICTVSQVTAQCMYQKAVRRLTDSEDFTLIRQDLASFGHVDRHETGVP